MIALFISTATLIFVITNYAKTLIELRNIRGYVDQLEHENEDLKTDLKIKEVALSYYQEIKK